eukprot:295048_1
MKKTIDHRIATHIASNIRTYKRFRVSLRNLKYDTNTSDNEILNQIEIGRLKAVLTQLMDEEPLISLSVIVPQIISKLPHQIEIYTSLNLSDSSSSDSNSSSGCSSDSNSSSGCSSDSNSS